MYIVNQNDHLQEERRLRALRTARLPQTSQLHVPTVLILALILVVYLILGALFAINTPAWQAPDEPAHYNYVAYVAENGSFPVLHFGDYPHGYLEQIKAAKFPPEMPITSIRYESHQPPLYYLLVAPLYSLTGGSLTALRLLSVLLGAGIVLFAYAIASRALPGQGAVALAAASIVAFLPQHLATVSQVGNDVLAELLLAAVLFVSVGIVRQKHSERMGEPESRTEPKNVAFPMSTYLLLGVLLGLILVTKTTAYVGVPLALGVVVWRWLKTKPPIRRIVFEALAVILPAAVIALPWYVRDIYVYGWPDFLGLIRHEQIVVGQTRTADWIAQNGWPAYWQRAAEWTFKSLVGVFGWMGVWLDTRVYYLLAVWLAIPVVAWLAGVLEGGRARVAGSSSIVREAERNAAPPAMGAEPNTLDIPDGAGGNDAGILSGAPSGRKVRSRRVPGTGNQRSVFAFLGAAVLLTFLTYIYYNITFLQHQGRYLFTALIPIAIFLALGWRIVFEPLVSRIVAIVLAAWSLLLAVWGVLTGNGLPRWPILITVVLAVAIALAGFLPERGRRRVYALPFALLPLVALYALFGAVVPALALR